LKDEDLVWLAAAIDGEGSIIHSVNHKRGTECWKVEVFNTNREFVEKAAKILGGRIYVREHENPNWSPCYHTEVADRKKLKELLPKLLPYLIIKRGLAQKALEWADVTDEEIARRKSQKISEKVKLRWKNPEYRKKMSETVKRQWQNPEIRRKMIEGSDGEAKERKREAAKRLWQTDEYRQKVFPKILAAVTSEKRRKLISKIFKEKWKDPEYRIKVIQGLRKSRFQPNLALRDSQHVH
jgi:hypothetical protein